MNQSKLQNTEEDSRGGREIEEERKKRELRTRGREEEPGISTECS